MTYATKKIIVMILFNFCTIYKVQNADNGNNRTHRATTCAKKQLH